MALFGRRAPVQVVTVSFRDLGEPTPTDYSAFRGYAYTWTLPTPPLLGHRVFVPGGDGRNAAAVVVGIGLPEHARGLQLLPVGRLATDNEIRAAWTVRRGEHAAWLDMARAAAGLTVPNAVRTRTPEGFPPMPPTTGDATRDNADDYARTWYRIWKEAEETGRPADEIKAYKALTFRWRAVRDRQK